MEKKTENNDNGLVTPGTLLNRSINQEGRRGWSLWRPPRWEPAGRLLVLRQRLSARGPGGEHRDRHGRGLELEDHP